MNVEIPSWELIGELNRRIEAREIFRSNDGKLWPRFCPACGGTITEYTVSINYSPWEAAVFDHQQWKRITRDLLDKEGLYLPDIPFRETGRFFLVRCDNSISDCDPCPVVNWEWFYSLDDARQNFFERASDYRR
jgi:hypothetical protein